MPFIHVRSLPFPAPLNVQATIEGLSEEFAANTNVGLKDVSITWEFLSAGHYAVGGQTAEQQQPNSHPVLVDLLVPDFNSEAAVEEMLTTVAAGISRLASIPEENIFINLRYAHSGRVFDAGAIVRW